MNISRLLWVLSVLSLGMFIGACDGKPVDTSAIIATVNGEPVTQNDYDDYMRMRQPQNQQFENKEKEKEVILKEMIDRILLTQAAVKSGLEQDKEVWQTLKRNRQNVLARAMIRKTLKDKPITDEEVQKRYAEESEKTHKKEYKVSHILYKSEEEAAAAIKKLQNKANFAALAKKESIDVQSGKKGGDLGWINQGMVVSEFFEGVLALEKGAVSKAPVKSNFGYHVIKVENSRPWSPPPFEQVKPMIYRHMQNERITDLIKQLNEGAKIQYR